MYVLCVYLDIESDDIDVEVECLEKLGVCCIGFVKCWWVMEVLIGYWFCIVCMCGDDGWVLVIVWF